MIYIYLGVGGNAKYISMANISLKISAINKKASDVIYSDVKTDSIALSKTLVNKQAVRNSVMNILSWRQGERCLFPDFGNRIPDYVFEKINSETLSAIQRDISAMMAYEPRIRLTDVNVSSSIDSQTIVIKVTYEIPLLSTSDSVSITIER